MEKISKEVEFPSWDREEDVVIVGYGYAGAASAISAHDSGAKTLILEKMANPGGCSILSGGHMAITDDVEGAITYLRHTQGGRCGEDLIKAMAQGLHDLPAYIEELAKTDGAKLTKIPKRGGTYPLPGSESLGMLRVESIPGFDRFPWVSGRMGYGQKLMKLLVDNVESRRIEVMPLTAAKELVTDAKGAVAGVKAEREGKRIAIKARRAMILASGGFEFNEKMKLENFEAKPVYSMGNPGNTGDGILMAQKVGANLWHMWHFHGSYGFKFPDYPFAFRNFMGGPRNPDRKVAWINVDKFGRRFMNECHPAPQDTMHRPLEYFDPDIQDYPRIPCYLIFDEEGRKLGPIANPLMTIPEYAYEWSPDNSKEIEKGWILKANTISELAEKIRIDPSNLQDTINRWNENYEAEKDVDFHRPPGTMVPIKNPPYYSIEAWPICTNTQGGPEHNAKQQIVDPYGNPIPRLYAAGELGSFYCHLYLLGGNMSECIIGGRIAGKMAASEEPWI